jgi:DNA-binding NtrC family response regulator
MSDLETKTEIEVPVSPVPVGDTEEGKSPNPGKGNGQSLSGGGFSLRRFRAKAEVEAISQALEQTGWHRKQAAQLLRISYRCLLYKIHQYKITRTQTLAPSSSTPNVE